ncbi:hypothetical protein ACIGG9_24795 [Pseudonocardia alni]|uniref:hypothetical protein n=1 Tax=Pseudonocardia alni TaxID=33907 RepID=UPI0033DACED7
MLSTDSDFDTPDSEHRRVHAAVRRAGGDWHSAAESLKGRVSWSRFVDYASTPTDTISLPDDAEKLFRSGDSVFVQDVAEYVASRMSPPDPTPDTDYRCERVRAAVTVLPPAEFQAAAVRAMHSKPKVSASEARTWRRARSRLAEDLADLAREVHRREASRHVCLLGFPVTITRGVPRRHLRSVPPWQPGWSPEWIDSVPPVPEHWADLAPGRQWRSRHNAFVLPAAA